MDTDPTSSIEDDFLLLVKEGNYDEVLNYLNHYDIDLEYINEEHDDCTALVIAASEGYFNICQLLIEKGANMYAGNSANWNPLMLACAYGHYQLVEYFISVGMDINLHNANGCTALMISCVRGHVPIVQLLIRFGVEINAFNLTNHTAVIVSSWYGYAYITFVLLNCDANINCATLDGKTPLIWATEYGHTTTVQLLLERGADPFIKDNEEKIAYDYAKDDETVRNLLLYHHIKQQPEEWTEKASKFISFDALSSFYEKQLKALQSELKYWQSLPLTEFTSGKSDRFNH